MSSYRRLVGDIETGERGVPNLIRQYLKLGGKFVSFNVDARFSNALDGLIVVDLLWTEPRMLERCMGRVGAAAFLQGASAKNEMPAIPAAPAAIQSAAFSRLTPPNA